MMTTFRHLANVATVNDDLLLEIVIKRTVACIRNFRNLSAILRVQMRLVNSKGAFGSVKDLNPKPLLSN